MKPPYDCKKVLERLKKGNQAHLDQAKAQSQSSKKIKNTDFVVKCASEGQEPYAAILTCADSRVIPEHIFNAGEGELFVVRVAGNIASPETIASLEYAIAELNVGVIVVMGHEDCGAVKAAMQFALDQKYLGYNLNQLVSHIVPSVEPGADPGNKKELKQSTLKNAKKTSKMLREQSAILRDAKGLLICSAYYHLTDIPGAMQVDFSKECDCKKA